MSSFAEQVRQAIPAEFHMISGSHDSQTSADVQNVGKFQLPNPAGTFGVEVIGQNDPLYSC